MNPIAKMKPVWLVGLMIGFMLISLSVGIRMVREELSISKRLEANLTELEGLVYETEAQILRLVNSIDGEASAPRSLFTDEQLKNQISWDTVQLIELPEGFRHQKITMLVSELAPEDLEGLLTRLENHQPAWRITGIQLETRTGRLHGSLQLEALDKSPLEL